MAEYHRRLANYSSERIEELQKQGYQPALDEYGKPIVRDVGGGQRAVLMQISMEDYKHIESARSIANDLNNLPVLRFGSRYDGSGKELEKYVADAKRAMKFGELFKLLLKRIFRRR